MPMRQSRGMKEAQDSYFSSMEYLKGYLGPVTLTHYSATNMAVTHLFGFLDFTQQLVNTSISLNFLDFRRKWFWDSIRGYNPLLWASTKYEDQHCGKRFDWLPHQQPSRHSKLTGWMFVYLDCEGLHVVKKTKENTPWKMSKKSYSRTCIVFPLISPAQ